MRNAFTFYGNHCATIEASFTMESHNNNNWNILRCGLRELSKAISQNTTYHTDIQGCLAAVIVGKVSRVR